MMCFVAGFLAGSLFCLLVRRRADRRLILALSERCHTQSVLLSKRAERRGHA